MCIAILTTAHPDYALILIDNRDEYVLRPTSLPHWWSPPASAPSSQILSSRDLLRPEHGTWLGVSRDGRIAVLTNYRETGPVMGIRSRGRIVAEWLEGAGPAQGARTTEEQVRRVVEAGLTEYAGFSMVCGRLRKRMGEDGERAVEPLAVVSNRAVTPDSVPWIAGRRGETYALSNTVYDDPSGWRKIADGKWLVRDVVSDAVVRGLPEAELAEKLFAVLDTDSMTPSFPEGKSGAAIELEQALAGLRNTIFVPPLGEQEVCSEALERDVSGGEFERGAYGTQRQTVVMVTWDGEIAFRERSLWDEAGRRVERGKGDFCERFKIDGWE